MVTPLGADTASSWRNLLEGVSAITRLEGDVYAKLPCRIAASVSKDIFDPEQHFSKSELRTMARSACFALMAAKEALKQVSFAKNAHRKK